jgi:hypothetical protein
MKRDEFLPVLTGLCDLYGKPASEFIFEMYYDIFKTYSYDEFSRAIKQCLRERKYANLPKPAEILEYLEGTTDDKALTAWCEVKEAIRKGGWVASIEFTDRVIPACIDQLGGWAWLCKQPKKEEPFLQKRFMDLYSLMLKRGETGDTKVFGFVETANRRQGFTEDIPEPVRIGKETFRIEDKGEE